MSAQPVFGGLRAPPPQSALGVVPVLLHPHLTQGLDLRQRPQPWRGIVTEHGPQQPDAVRADLQCVLLQRRLVELYVAAEAAGLPPSDDTLDDVVVHENILSAVLSAHAVLSTAGQGHRTGAPGIGEAIGAILRGESLELTTKQVAWDRRAAFTRMLTHLQYVEGDVDLRTVAALACGVQGRRTMLRTNPTGHGPEVGLWSPASEFNRTAYLARWRVEREIA
ncbi:hypothetical protein [Streptomyces sp. NPDC059278]|uniref:hypothetical protein n=1 Tax=Streptomyces sp. NPDC059278 TaxID=3346801 RepID=UPI0036AA9CAD